MMFCPACGRLMTETDFGFECLCGAYADKSGNQIDLATLRMMQKNVDKVKKRRGYRYKYENMGDDEDESHRKCKNPYRAEDTEWI